MKLTPSVFVLLAACSHSAPFPTGPTEILGPISSSSTQLTFNSGDDYAPSWTPDGSRIVYTYANEDVTKVQAGSRCIAMLDAAGGTRTFSLCDTRSSQSDSASMFSAAALRADGELLFMQGTGKPANSPIPRTMALWIADTANPLGVRRKLATFPKVIGDSVIEFLTEAAWTDPNTFIAMGSRLSFPCRNIICNGRDTLVVPVYMVRGTFTGEDLTFAQIPGTLLAAKWARLPNGDIIFVRGNLVPGLPATVVNETTIRKVPSDGGTADTYAISPNGAAVRGITCQAGTCFVLTTVLYRLNPESAALTTINLGVGLNFSTWDSPALSPDGSVLVYRVGRNLFRAGVPAP